MLPNLLLDPSATRAEETTVGGFAQIHLIWRQKKHLQQWWRGKLLFSSSGHQDLLWINKSLLGTSLCFVRFYCTCIIWRAICWSSALLCAFFTYSALLLFHLCQQQKNLSSWILMTLFGSLFLFRMKNFSLSDFLEKPFNILPLQCCFKNKKQKKHSFNVNHAQILKYECVNMLSIQIQRDGVQVDEQRISDAKPTK